MGERGSDPASRGNAATTADNNCAGTFSLELR